MEKLAWRKVREGRGRIMIKFGLYTHFSGNWLDGLKQESDMISLHFEKIILAAVYRMDYKGAKQQVGRPEEAEVLA